MNAENIDSRYKLLMLINEGNTSGILTDKALRDSLNDLMKFELITIYNNKLRITERGKTALKNGIHSVMKKVKVTPKNREILKPEGDYLMELVITITILLFVIFLFMIL